MLAFVLIEMLVFAFSGLALLKVATRCTKKILRGLLVLIGSVLTVLAASCFYFGLYWTVCVDRDLLGAVGLAGAIALIFIVFRSRTPPVPKPGHCRKCGYDLTGNTGGVCPECGLKTDPIPTPTANTSVTAPP